MAGVGIAAGVAAAATVASAGMSVASSMGAMGGSSSGGSSSKPSYQQVPQDPITKAQRSYWDRLAVANANKTYPSFAAYTESGGDPSTAKFDLTVPGLTPQEMTGFGFTGPQGQPVPTTPVDQASQPGATLTNQQLQFLGKQRSKEAQQQGGPGNATPLQRLGQVSTRLGNVQDRLTAMGPTDLPEGPGPAGRQGRLQDRLETRVANLQNRQQQLLQKTRNM